MILAAITTSILIAMSQVTPPSALEQATQAQAQAYVFARPSPGIHLSPSGGARYAMAQGCIPHVVTGKPAREFFQTAAISRTTGEGRHAVTSAVILQEDPIGSCTSFARRPRGAARRDAEGLRRGRRQSHRSK